MAEAVFQISAEIVPVANERELQRQAERMSKQFNNTLSKQIRPINVATSDKAVQQMATTVKQTGNEVVRTTKATNAYQQALKNAQAVIERSLQRTKESGNAAVSVFSRLLKPVQDLAQKGFKQLATEAEKIAPALNKLQQLARTAGTNIQNAFQNSKRHVIGFLDKVGATNTKLIQYGGRIRDAIKDNKLFKSALQGVNNSVGVISSLPGRFKAIEAQVTSGTSSLQMAAKNGDSMARNLVPFLTIAVGISKALAVVNENIRQLSTAVTASISKTTSFAERFRAFGANAEGATQQATKGFKTLLFAAKDSDVATKTIQQTFDRLSARGAKGLIKGLEELRPQLKQIAIDTARAGGDFTNFDKIIKRTLFDLDPSNLGFFDRFSVKMDMFFQKFRDADAKVINFSTKVGDSFNDFMLPINDAIAKMRGRIETLSPAFTRAEQGVGQLGGLFSWFVGKTHEADAALMAYGHVVLKAARNSLSLFDTFKRGFEIWDNLPQTFRNAADAAKFMAIAISDRLAQAFRSGADSAVEFGRRMAQSAGNIAVTGFTNLGDAAKFAATAVSGRLAEAFKTGTRSAADFGKRIALASPAVATLGRALAEHGTKVRDFFKGGEKPTAIENLRRLSTDTRLDEFGMLVLDARQKFVNFASGLAHEAEVGLMPVTLFFGKISVALKKFNEEAGITDKASDIFTRIGEKLGSIRMPSFTMPKRGGEDGVDKPEKPVFGSALEKHTAAAQAQAQKARETAAAAEDRFRAARRTAAEEEIRYQGLQAQREVNQGDVTKRAVEAQYRVFLAAGRQADTIGRDAAGKSAVALELTQKAEIQAGKLEAINKRIAAAASLASGNPPAATAPAAAAAAAEDSGPRVRTATGPIRFGPKAIPPEFKEDAERSARETVDSVANIINTGLKDKVGKAAPGVLTPFKETVVAEGADAGKSSAEAFLEAQDKTLKKGGDDPTGLTEVVEKAKKKARGHGEGITGKMADGMAAGAEAGAARTSGIFGKMFGGIGAGAKGAGGPIRALSQIIGGAGGLGGLMGGVSLGSAGLAAALIGIGTAALTAAGKFEKLRVALSGILGETQGAIALENIAEFAARTPFRLEEAATAVIKLTSSFQGLGAVGAQAILEQVAGAAAAVGASGDAINRVTLAFTQINAAGKLTSDNLRQITEALPNVNKVTIIRELGKNLNVTTEEARKLLNEGMAPLEEGMDAIVVAMHKVPGATTALEKQSKTFEGLTSTTKDLAQQALAALGGPLIAVAGVALGTVNIALAAIAGILPMLIDGLTKMPLLLGAVAAGFMLVTKSFMGTLAPLLLFAGAVYGLVKAFEAAREKWTAFAEFTQPFVDQLGKLAVGLGFTSEKVEETGDQAEIAAAKLAVARRAVNSLLTAVDALVASNGLAEFTDNLITLESIEEEQASKLMDSQIGVAEKILATKSAFDGVKSAAQGVRDAQAAYNDAIAEHNQGLADEAIKLNKDLAKAKETVADASDKQVKAQEALTEALKGSSADELERGDMALASAKLRLRQLIEDEKKAQDELNATQRVSVDIGGMSLDQVKSRLRTVRASLAATKAIKKEDDKKSPEQKEIDTLTASITRRSAELDIKDATKATLELRKLGTELDPAVIAAREAVKEADEGSRDALAAQQEIEGEILKLYAVDLEFQEELQGLQAGITKAKEAQRDAEIQQGIVIARNTGNKAEELRLLGLQIFEMPELIQLLKDTNMPIDTKNALEEAWGIKIDGNKTKIVDSRTELEKFNGEMRDLIANADKFGLNVNTLRANVDMVNAQNAGPDTGPYAPGKLLSPEVKELVNQFLAQKGAPDLINEMISVVADKNFGGNIKDPVFVEYQQRFTDVALTAAAKALTAGAKTDKEIIAAIKDALKLIPGLPPLKFAQGAIMDRPTAGIFGEAGREVILPLTRPARMMDLLANKKVLPPVLAALERIVLPGLGKQLDQTHLSIDQPLETRRVRSASQSPNAQDQAKRDRAFAQAIVTEMKAAGFTGGGQTTVTNDFTAPDPKNPLAVVQARQIAREVKRQIEKLL